MTTSTEILLTAEPYALSFIRASVQSMPGLKDAERIADNQIRLRYQGDDTHLNQLQDKLAQLPGLLHWQQC